MYMYMYVYMHICVYIWYSNNMVKKIKNGTGHSLQTKLAGPEVALGDSESEPVTPGCPWKVLHVTPNSSDHVTW